MTNELIGIISNEGELKGVIEDNSFNVIVQITESGPKGNDGYSIEYQWNGTALGIKREDEVGYNYTDLKGEKGDTGSQGIPGLNGKSIEYQWDGTRLGIRLEGEASYQYVDLRGQQGIQGVQGRSIEYNWNGTSLGVRVEGESNYQYINLKGDKGDTGEKGEKGTDGKDGYTPQKGVDYYTDADKAEMVSTVLAALPVYGGEVESV